MMMMNNIIIYIMITTLLFLTNSSPQRKLSMRFTQEGGTVRHKTAKKSFNPPAPRVVEASPGVL